MASANRKWCPGNGGDCLYNAVGQRFSDLIESGVGEFGILKTRQNLLVNGGLWNCELMDGCGFIGKWSGFVVQET